jgi:hypothetical protein
MNAADILSRARGRGVSLELHSCALRVRDPYRALTSVETGALLEQQHEFVLALMRSTDPAAVTSANTAPLTFQQEWIMERHGYPFCAPFTAHLRGSLDIDALFRSVQSLHCRHEALRTAIVVTESNIYQEVRPVGHCDMQFIDVQNGTDSWSNTTCDTYIEALIQNWVEAANSVFAIRVLKVSRQEHILIVLWEHAHFDYFSSVLLFKELWAVYQKLYLSQVPPVRHAMQCPQYAVWQRREFSAKSHECRIYWRNRLAKAVPAKICIDQEPEGAATKPFTFMQEIDQALSDSLGDFGENIGTPKPFVVASLTALGISAFSGQRDFTVPMSYFGRYGSAQLDMIGYFPNYVLLQIDLEHRVTFADLCGAIAREYFTGIAHLDCGQNMDGGRPELLRVPFIQWFPNAASTDVVAPSKSSWNEEALRLSVEPYLLSSCRFLDRPSLKNDFTGQFAWHESHGSLTSRIDRIRLSEDKARFIERIWQKLPLVVTQIARDPGTSVASLLALL